MNAKHITASLLLAATLGLGACTHADQHSSTAQPSTSTVHVQPACSDAVDDSDALEILDGPALDSLILACDARATHTPCQEDEWCALASINAGQGFVPAP